jgi:HEAT repeat protein
MNLIAIDNSIVTVDTILYTVFTDWLTMNLLDRGSLGWSIFSFFGWIRKLISPALLILCLLFSPSILLQEGTTAYAQSQIQSAEQKLDIQIKSLIKELEKGDSLNRLEAAEALVQIGKPAISALISVLGNESWVVRMSAAEALGKIGKPAVPTLIRMLENKGSHVSKKIAAIKVLGKIGPEAKNAVPSLISALGNKNWRVREGAAKVLGRFGPEEAKEVVPALIIALGDNSYYVRMSAAEALGRFGPEEAKEVVPALIIALGDEIWNVRRTAAEALGRFGPEETKEVVPALIIALGDNSHDVRMSAAEALGKIGPEAKNAVPSLISALGNQNWRVREGAAKFLGRFGPEEAKEVVPALIIALGDNSGYVRISAAEALGQIGPEAKNAVPFLISALGNQNWRVREGAAKFLGRFGPEEAKEVVPALIIALEDNSLSVRMSAAEALGKIGPEAKEAVPALIRTMEDKSSNVRRSAAEALGQIGPEAKNAVPSLISALGNQNWRVREGAAKVLGRFGPEAKEAVPALIIALGDNSHDVRMSAAEALGKIGPEAKEAVPALLRTLGYKSRSGRINRLAAEALGKIGPEAKNAVPSMISALGNQNWRVREGAAKVLGMFGPEEAKEAVPALMRALGDEMWLVREAAAEALGKFGIEAKDVVPALIIALGDEIWKVRRTAAEALGKFGPEAKDAVPALFAALVDENSQVSKSAAEALGNIVKKAVPARNLALGDEHKDVVPALLLRALGNEIGLVRKDAVPALIRALGAAEAPGKIGKPAVPALIRVLENKHKKLYIRQSAAEALGKIGHEAREAVPALLRVLGNKVLGQSAAVALIHIGHETKDAVPALIRALKNKSLSVRKSAVKALGKFGSEAKQAVPVMIDVLGDKNSDYDVRKLTATALGEIGPEANAAVPALIIALMGGERQLAAKAAEALIQIGPEAMAAFSESKAAVPTLLHWLGDKNSEVRKLTAIALLGGIGPEAKAAVPALIIALGDESGDIRKFAADALGKIGSEAKEGVPALIIALGNESGDVRKFAADALGKIGPEAKEGVPALIIALGDGDWSVRNSTADALGKIGPEAKAAVPALIKVLKEEIPGEERGMAPLPLLHQTAMSALVNIGSAAVPALIEVVQSNEKWYHSNLGKRLGEISPGARAVPALIEIVQSEEEEFRFYAAGTLGALGPEAKAAIPALIKALGDEEAYIVKIVRQAMGKIGPGNEAELIPIINLLDDPKLTVVKDTLEAIGKMGITAVPAVPKLMTLLNGNTVEREAVLDVFEKIGGKETFLSWRIALKSGDKGIRILAAEELQKLGEQAKIAIPGLILALNDHEPEVRTKAGAALVAMGRAAVPALIQALENKDKDLQIEAARLLGEIGPEAQAAVKPLMDIAGDTGGIFTAGAEDNLRVAAILSLGKLGNERATRLLEAAMNDANETIRQAAQQARTDMGEVDTLIPNPNRISLMGVVLSLSMGVILFLSLWWYLRIMGKRKNRAEPSRAKEVDFFSALVSKLETELASQGAGPLREKADEIWSGFDLENLSQREKQKLKSHPRNLCLLFSLACKAYKEIDPVVYGLGVASREKLSSYAKTMEINGLRRDDFESFLNLWQSLSQTEQSLLGINIKEQLSQAGWGSRRFFKPQHYENPAIWQKRFEELALPHQLEVMRVLAWNMPALGHGLLDKLRFTEQGWLLGQMDNPVVEKVWSSLSWFTGKTEREGLKGLLLRVASDPLSENSGWASEDMTQISRWLQANYAFNQENLLRWGIAVHVFLSMTAGEQKRELLFQAPGFSISDWSQRLYSSVLAYTMRVDSSQDELLDKILQISIEPYLGKQYGEKEWAVINEAVRPGLKRWLDAYAQESASVVSNQVSYGLSGILREKKLTFGDKVARFFSPLIALVILMLGSMISGPTGFAFLVLMIMFVVPNFGEKLVALAVLVLASMLYGPTGFVLMLALIMFIVRPNLRIQERVREFHHAKQSVDKLYKHNFGTSQRKYVGNEVLNRVWHTYFSQLSVRTAQEQQALGFRLALLRHIVNASPDFSKQAEILEILNTLEKASEPGKLLKGLVSRAGLTMNHKLLLYGVIYPASDKLALSRLAQMKDWFSKFIKFIGFVLVILVGTALRVLAFLTHFPLLPQKLSALIMKARMPDHQKLSALIMKARNIMYMYAELPVMLEPDQHQYVGDEVLNRIWQTYLSQLSLSTAQEKQYIEFRLALLRQIVSASPDLSKQAEILQILNTLENVSEPGRLIKGLVSRAGLTMEQKLLLYGVLYPASDKPALSRLAQMKDWFSRFIKFIGFVLVILVGTALRVLAFLTHFPLLPGHQWLSTSIMKVRNIMYMYAKLPVMLEPELYPVATAAPWKDKFQENAEHTQRLLSLVDQLLQPATSRLGRRFEQGVSEEQAQRWRSLWQALEADGFKVEYGDFIDTTWLPWFFRITRHSRWQRNGHVHLNLHEKRIILSKHLPDYMNALLLVKLSSVVLGHAVLPRDTYSLYLPPLGMLDLQKGLLWRSYEYQIEQGLNLFSGQLRALLHLLWLKSFANQYLYAYPAATERVMAEQKGLVRHEWDRLLVFFSRLSPQKSAVLNLEKVKSILGARVERDSVLSLMSLWELRRMGIMLIFFITIFGSLLFSLDLSYLHNTINDFFIWAYVHLGWLGESLSTIWNWILAQWEMLKGWVSKALAYIGINIEMLQAAWNRFKQKVIVPVAEIFRFYIEPIFYTVIMPLWLYALGLLYGGLLFFSGFEGRVRRLSDQGLYIGFIKGGEWLSRIIVGVRQLISSRGNFSSTVSSVQTISERLYHKLRAPLLWMVGPGIRVGIIGSLFLYFLVLLSLSFPPLDWAYIFHVAQSAGLPLNVYIVLLAVTLFIGLPYLSGYNWYYRLPSDKVWNKIKMVPIGMSFVIAVALPGGMYYYMTHTPASWSNWSKQTLVMEVSRWMYKHKWHLGLRELFVGEELIDPYTGWSYQEHGWEEWYMTYWEKPEEQRRQSMALYGNSPLLLKLLEGKYFWPLLKTRSPATRDAIANNMLEELKNIIEGRLSYPENLTYRERLFFAGEAQVALHALLFGTGLQERIPGVPDNKRYSTRYALSTDIWKKGWELYQTLSESAYDPYLQEKLRLGVSQIQMAAREAEKLGFENFVSGELSASGEVAHLFEKAKELIAHESEAEKSGMYPEWLKLSNRLFMRDQQKQAMLQLGLSLEDKLMNTGMKWSEMRWYLEAMGEAKAAGMRHMQLNHPEVIAAWWEEGADQPMIRRELSVWLKERASSPDSNTRE